VPGRKGAGGARGLSRVSLPPQMGAGDTSTEESGTQPGVGDTSEKGSGTAREDTGGLWRSQARGGGGPRQEQVASAMLGKV
jgi:hypothetical protein